MWDLIVSVPDHCLSFYYVDCLNVSSSDRLLENQSRKSQYVYTICSS